MDPSSSSMADDETRIKKMETVPAWEKEFCLKVGLFEWEEFIEAKEFEYIDDVEYENIMVWDDSASKQAFDVAKERFKALSFGLPCNTNLLPCVPMNNEEQVIDWNQRIEPELLLGLEVCPEDLAYSRYKNKNGATAAAEEGNLYNKKKNGASSAAAEAGNFSWNDSFFAMARFLGFF